MIEEHPAGFPVPLTPLIGREREIVEVSALLSQGGVRLLTLTGPGGVGKTRLAIAAARAYGATSGVRQCFVDLAPLSQPELVLQAIAQHLNVRETGGEPLEARVISALRDAPMLLVLDNFEQVVGSAVLLPGLLAACPSLTMLVTSRERLRVSGDQEYEVRPLTLPGALGAQSPEVLMQAEAVRFFVERARAVRHDFALTTANATAVATICAQLDGLPLAIELAAARINALPPALLLERLEQALTLLTGGGRDRPIRLQTMRDAIAWSYNLLSAEEQRLSRQLAIFAGGCTVEAAEAVTGEAGAPVLDGLISLVDKSLLRQEEQPDGRPRFRMLETVREFGREQIEITGELASVRARHATYFLELAEGRDPDVPVKGDFNWIARLVPEHDNLRQALASLEEAEDWRRLLCLAAALGEFWQIRGQFDEARRWLRLALDRDPASPTELRVKALQALGLLAYFRGSYAEARSFHEEVMELACSPGLEYPLAFAHFQLGAVAYRTGDLDRATSLLNKALASFMSLVPNRPSAATEVGSILDLLGDTAIMQGEIEIASERFEQAIERLRRSHYHWMLVDALGGLGVVNLMRGDTARAATLYLEGLELGLSDNNIQHTASILARLTAVAAEFGQPERSGRLLGAAEALRQRIGAVIYPRDSAVVERCLNSLRSELDEEQLSALREEGRSLTPDQVLAEAKAMMATDERAAAATRGTATPFGLTARELDVLRLLVEGLSDNEIADQLFVSRRTVTTHTSSIFRKLGVSGRAEAAAMVVRRELV